MELLEICCKDVQVRKLMPFTLDPFSPTAPRQEIEFTIENAVLYILETKRAKCSPYAAVCFAVSMVKEMLITEREALLRIDPHQMQYFLHPMIDPTYGSYHYACMQNYPTILMVINEQVMRVTHTLRRESSARAWPHHPEQLSGRWPSMPYRSRNTAPSKSPAYS